MRILTGVTLGAAALVILGGAALWAVLPHINDRQTSGTLNLPGLSAEVRVVRDSRGTPYIHAETFQDALRAQGFVAGQDRLFQLETAKRAATGRLAEVFGAGPDDVVLNLDREARVIGFHRLGERQADVLARRPRENLKAYVDGLNAYIETRSGAHPLEFQLAGFEPEVWSQADMLAVMYFLGWSSSANFDAELLAQRLIDGVGADAFEEIAPLTVNPDDPDAAGGGEADDLAQAAAGPGGRWTGPSALAPGWTQGGWSVSGAGGSNNWAMSGAKAGAPAAVVTNDPHLDSRILPGPWHPVGLITPDLRIVGVSAGMPGVVIGRNEHIALGVTNAYADAVDLYVETLDPEDPDRYLEGERSLPFETVVETIRIKDETAETGVREEALPVRFTRRGPVITDHDPGRAAGHVLSLRWATAEYMSPQLGIEPLMTARSVEEAVAAIQQVRIVSLNFVVGDTQGRIARHASGVAPIRLRGNGMAPFPVTDGVDNWAGPIPPEEMPGEIDPPRGWTGSANHMTAPADYPYVYTSYASPAYRYRRMQALFDAPQVTAEDAWAAQYDTLNLFARDLAPILSRALVAADEPALQELGETLGAWDHHDDQDGVETTLFQETIRHLARLTFEDELGSELTTDYLDNWYVWQERFDAMVQAGDSPWFDDAATPQTETLPVLIRRAGSAALDRLTQSHGPNRADWRWGAVHRMRFQGPLRRDGLVGRLTGNQDLAMSGSGETLLRALYPFNQPFDPQWSASLRMTADLNDPDKVRAVLPGGVVGRTFHPHLSDQTAHWATAEPDTYWWFSDEAIAAAARSELVLRPPAP